MNRQTQIFRQLRKAETEKELMEVLVGYSVDLYDEIDRHMTQAADVLGKPLTQEELVDMVYGADFEVRSVTMLYNSLVTNRRYLNEDIFLQLASLNLPAFTFTINGDAFSEN